MKQDVKYFSNVQDKKIVARKISCISERTKLIFFLIALCTENRIMFVYNSFPSLIRE